MKERRKLIPPPDRNRLIERNTQHHGKTVDLKPQEMWKMRNRELDGGIEGYKVPKEEWDVAAIKWKKLRGDILKNPKAHRKDPKIDEETGKVILPKRPNFLDDLFKWSNSYYNKTKAEEILEDKGPDFNKPQPPKKIKEIKIEYPKRKFFTDLLIRDQKKNYEQPQWDGREEAIDNVKEKIEEHEKSKVPWLKKTIEKYSVKNEQGKLIKATMGVSTRVTVVSEAIHVGEKIPFYNTYKDPEGDEEKNGKEFFPRVRFF